MDRLAAYIRLSEETEETTSPTRQRNDIEKLILDHGAQHDPELDVYEDIDMSAYSGRTRPAFEQMMSNLHRYDGVVVWKVDRLLRSVRRDLSRIREEFNKHNVKLYSVNEGILGGGPGGDFILTVYAGLAEFESATAGLRIKSAQQHLLQTGRWRGGTVPFGYVVEDHPDGGLRLAIKADEAELILEAVNRLLKGESSRSICSDFNERGLRSKRGGMWTTTAFLYMMRNPRLTGQISTSYEEKLPDGKTRRVPDVVRDEDGEPIFFEERAILSMETWQRLQKEIKRKSFRKSRTKNATLLSGLVRCGTCESGMIGWTADDPRARYICSLRVHGGKGACEGSGITRQRLDEYVTAAAWARYTAEHLDEARRRVAEAEPVETPTFDIVERIAKLRAGLDRLERDRYETDLFNGRDLEYRERVREYTTEIRALEKKHRASQEQVGDEPHEWIPPGQGLEDVWEDLDLLKKRQVIASVVDRILIGNTKKGWRFEKQLEENPDRVRIYWADKPHGTEEGDETEV